MNQYKVTFKRTEVFYQAIRVEASTPEKAHEKAELLASDGGVEFDYFHESDIIDEHIIGIEKV